jgi:hypothetical protein
MNDSTNSQTATDSDGMQTGGTEQIELTDRQRKRLDRIKSECANDHLPEPSDQLMLSSLMDTWDAVDEGLYAEPPRERSFFDRVVSRIRRVLSTGTGRQGGDL